MKIEVAKEDLQKLRDIVWQGRAHYGKKSVDDTSVSQMCISREKEAGTKFMKRLNQALKKVHGHDCSAEHYQ